MKPGGLVADGQVPRLAMPRAVELQRCALPSIWSSREPGEDWWVFEGAEAGDLPWNRFLCTHTLFGSRKDQIDDPHHAFEHGVSKRGVVVARNGARSRASTPCPARHATRSIISPGQVFVMNTQAQ